jgi:pyruvate dehydrogenase E2 component (dihydrolipoamide acetyltransferase)
VAGTYTRSREGGFRKIAKAFWGPPEAGLIYGHAQIDVHKARRFQDDVEAKHGVRPSMGHLLGKAISYALTVVPEGNAKIIWGKPYVKDTIDVYFQVDVADGKDLSGVVVPDTGRKTVVEVAKLLRDRAERLRKGDDKQYEKTQKGCVGKLPSWAIRHLLGFLTFLEYNLGITPTALGARPEPFGTVMVTNVSGFGVDVAYAPLVPVSRVPFVALMGRVEDRAWVDEQGELCVRPILTASATFDHRLLDGNKIGKIVRTVRAWMENPYAYEGEAVGLPDPYAAEANGADAEAEPEDSASAPGAGEGEADEAGGGEPPAG